MYCKLATFSTICNKLSTSPDSHVRENKNEAMKTLKFHTTERCWNRKLKRGKLFVLVKLQTKVFLLVYLRVFPTFRNSRVCSFNFLGIDLNHKQHYLWLLVKVFINRMKFLRKWSVKYFGENEFHLVIILERDFILIHGNYFYNSYLHDLFVV